jgi:hypothetical protein
MKKLKELPYVSYREAKDLDNAEVIYIDYSIDNENGTKPDVFCSKIQCGSYEIDDAADLLDFIEKFFIDTVMYFNKESVNIDKSLELTIDNILTKLDSRRGSRFNGRSEESFVIKPEALELTLRSDINVVSSKYLTDKVIVGKKTLIDEPGILLVSNDEGLADKMNIRFGLMTLGHHPEDSYEIIKL